MTNVFDGNVFNFRIESNIHGHWVCWRKKPIGVQNLINFKVDDTCLLMHQWIILNSCEKSNTIRVGKKDFLCFLGQQHFLRRFKT